MLVPIGVDSKSYRNGLRYGASLCHDELYHEVFSLFGNQAGHVHGSGLAFNMIRFPLIIVVFVLSFPLHASERPNILVISSEDNAWNWLGCYGNKDAHTPRMDALSCEGFLFNRAYSNAPVCAVARSTILNGVHAVTQGTQHMRSRHRIPANFESYVSYLRAQGYYCTNNSKTDYNFKGDDAAIWDDCSQKAHYKSCPADKPFFAIFNLTVSHESSLFPKNIEDRRKRGMIPRSPRLDPAKLQVPPYLPDLPEIRSDIAIYHDQITLLDKQVGKLLDELAERGRADDTIVIYYSDHGGILPRGKRYLMDTGVRVPMIVRVPKKWLSYAPFKPGQRIDEIVSFVDLAPTILSLAGMDKPAQMQGRAFLGPKRMESKKDAAVFLYADRFDEIYGMRRGITDGRWKYIRCFTPHLPAAPYSFYQFGQSGWSAWQKAWQEGKLDAWHNRIWETPQAVESLFDTLNDPWETQNLAEDPAHAERLAAMRERLKRTMIETVDTGLVPEPMFADLSPEKPIASWLGERKADIPDLVDLAFTATAAKPENLSALQAGLSSENPLTRYWSAHGCLILGKSASATSESMVKLLDDSHSAIRVVAAHQLHQLGSPLGKKTLIAELEKAVSDEALLNLMNTLKLVDAIGDIPDSWMRRTLNDPKAKDYVKRFVEQLDKARR
jgi:arylsulfatase A-like enzyme